MSGMLKATSNGIRLQLHLLIKVSCISNILLTVVLYTTLKPNGKFCMGLTNSLNALNASVFTEVASLLSGYLHLFYSQLCTVFREKLTNRKWFSVVCTLIDNDIRHHSGQNVVDSRGAAE